VLPPGRDGSPLPSDFSRRLPAAGLAKSVECTNILTIPKGVIMFALSPFKTEASDTLPMKSQSYSHCKTELISLR